MDKNINMQINQFSEEWWKNFADHVIIGIFSLLSGKDNKNRGWKVVGKVNSLKKLSDYIYFNSVLIYSSLEIRNLRIMIFFRVSGTKTLNPIFSCESPDLVLDLPEAVKLPWLEVLLCLCCSPPNLYW